MALIPVPILIPFPNLNLDSTGLTPPAAQRNHAFPSDIAYPKRLINSQSVTSGGMVSWRVDPPPYHPLYKYRSSFLLTSHLHLHYNLYSILFPNIISQSPLPNKKQCFYRHVSSHASLPFSFLFLATSVPMQVHIIMIILVRHLAIIHLGRSSTLLKLVSSRTGHGANLEVK